MYEDELSVAPLLVTIDFQKAIKVAQGASVLGEYTPWIDLELATWGFQDTIDDAENKVTVRLQEKLGGDIYGISESTKKESSRFIYFLTKCLT